MGYCIYSANEAATNGAGFWNNKDGWVEDVTEADQFDSDEIQKINMPYALGNDAKFVSLNQDGTWGAPILSVNFHQWSDDVLKSEIEAEEKIINAKSKRVALMRNELLQRAIKNAPFKVGDRVCSETTPACKWGARSETTAFYQWDITHVFPEANGYRLMGIRIKKDGEPYKNRDIEYIHPRHKLSLVEKK